jgi:hypothetical protein
MFCWGEGHLAKRVSCHGEEILQGLVWLVAKSDLSNLQCINTGIIRRGLWMILGNEDERR